MAGASEVELKLALPAAALPALRAHPALAALRAGRVRRARLAATYYDTPDAALAGAGYALRVRREGGVWVQALKAAGTQAGGLAVRPEHTWALGRGPRAPAPDLGRLAAIPDGRAALRVLAGRTPAPLFVADVVRSTLPLAWPDGTRALAALDVGAIVTAAEPARGEAVCELELEVVDGGVAPLFALAQALACDLPLAAEPRSKAARGVALARGLVAAPLRAAPVAYGADATTGEALASVLRGALAQVDANARGLAADADPEWVHQFRVGLRRLRSTLSLLPAAERTRAAPLALAGDLRWIAGVAGRARDLDVFAGDTLPAIAAAAREAGHARSAGWVEALAAAADAARGAARGDLRAAIGTARYRRLVLALGAFLATGLDAPAPARGHAQAALHKRHRALARHADALVGHDAAARHAARIAAKKLRYAAECFAPLDRRRRADAYRRRLAALQEVLGRLNDLAVAVDVAAKAMPQDDGAVALVAGWALARAAGEAAPLAAAWRAFVRAKRPFGD